MGQITDKRVINYLNKVKKTFNAKIILFGSRARGDALIESDYDFCVISEKFKGIDIRARLEDLYHLMINNPINAEIIAVTPEEFNRLSKSLTIYQDIKRYGVSV
jgi:predicted nucleotidyltransferase